MFALNNVLFAMKRFCLVSILLALCSLLSALAQDPASDDPDVLYAGTLLQSGTVAPDFTLQDVEGNSVNLRDFRGRYVVLAFWASWCPDCRAEIPELREMYEKYDPEMLRIVVVSFDRTLEKLNAFLTENPFPWTVLFDPAGMKESAIGKAYGVKWIPSLFLIGPDGGIITRSVIASRIEKNLHIQK